MSSKKLQHPKVTVASVFIHFEGDRYVASGSVSLSDGNTVCVSRHFLAEHSIPHMLKTMGGMCVNAIVDRKFCTILPSKKHVATTP